MYRYIKSEIDLYKELDRVRSEYEDIKSKVRPIREQIVTELIDNIKVILDTLGMGNYFDIYSEISLMFDFIEMRYTKEARINDGRYATVTLNYQDFFRQHGKDEFYIKSDFGYSYYSNYKEPGVSTDALKKLQMNIKNMLADFEVYVKRSYPNIEQLVMEVNTKLREFDDVQSRITNVEREKKQKEAKQSTNKSSHRKRRSSNKKYKYSLVYQDAPSYDPMVEKQEYEFKAQNDVAAVLYSYDTAHICSLYEVLDYLYSNNDISEDDYEYFYSDDSSHSEDDIADVASSVLTLKEAIDLDPNIDDQGNIIELKNTSTGKVLIKGTFMGPNGESEDEYYAEEEDW